MEMGLHPMPRTSVNWPWLVFARGLWGKAPSFKSIYTIWLFPVVSIRRSVSGAHLTTIGVSGPAEGHNRPRNLFGGMMSFVNNNSVIVIMNRICFATKRMSVFIPTLDLSGFFDVLGEIKKKMLNLRYNLWTDYEQRFQNLSIDLTLTRIWLENHISIVANVEMLPLPMLPVPNWLLELVIGNIEYWQHFSWHRCHLRTIEIYEQSQSWHVARLFDLNFLTF